LGELRKPSETDIREDGIWKKCNKCLEWKPLDRFFKKKSGTAGTRSVCKCCEGVTNVPKRIENKNGIDGKVCGKCEKWKPLTGYSKSKNNLGGYYSLCKDCRRDYRLDRKGAIVEYQRKYKAENREKLNIHTIKRRTLKRSLPFDFTNEEKDVIFNEFNRKCALTDQMGDIQWDHVIPLATGHGGTTFGNMIPLHKDLNESKKDKNVFEWFEANRQRFNLSQEKFDLLIDWLASANAVSVEDYRDYVYWCHANPHCLEDLETGRESEEK
jgi:hypothetical protein